MTNILPLIGPHITLAQAVKVAGLVGSGGQAKHLVRQGNLLVNGVVETRPGRKLFAGDRFTAGDAEWVITAETKGEDRGSKIQD
jgi:ribosome-associated protein